MSRDFLSILQLDACCGSLSCVCVDASCAAEIRSAWALTAKAHLISAAQQVAAQLFSDCVSLWMHEV